jgi:MFS family permease
MVPEKAHASSRIFYGWYVMAAGFFLLFFQSGARYSFGIMFKPMMAELGWSRASISSVFFLNMVFLALTMTVAGRFYDRYGPKWVIFISTVLLAAGYICTSWMHTLWQFHLFYGVLTAIGTGGATIPLSLALSGACLGQFFLVPIFNRLVLIYSWRISYLLIGLIILVVNTILAFTVFKGDPEDLGIQPYGRTDTQNRADPDGCGNSVPSAKDLNLKQAMKTYSFWLFLVSMFICGGGDFLIIIHLVPFATDYGVAPTAAANMLALSGLMSLGGILIAGPVSDLIGNKIPIAASFVLRLLLFLMILKYRTPISFYIFAGGFGFTLLITAPLVTTLTGRLYGFAHLGLISGFVTTIHHLGGGFWTYMGGLLFDKTGSYQIILAVSAVLAVIATICTMALKEKRHLI